MSDGPKIFDDAPVHFEPREASPVEQIVASGVGSLVGHGLAALDGFGTLGRGIGSIAGAVAAWLTYKTRATPLDAAVGIDSRLGLKERVSSALAIGEPRRDDEAALVEDAAVRVRALRVREAFPIQAPRELRWIPVLAAV